VLELTREVPDTQLAGQFAGEPMVQTFAVHGLGIVWITTTEAMRVPGFGRPWVAGQLTALRRELGEDEFARRLADGLRLYAEAPALALAA
jgi:hypothetical protein